MQPVVHLQHRVQVAGVAVVLEPTWRLVEYARVRVVRRILSEIDLSHRVSKELLHLQLDAATEGGGCCCCFCCCR